MNHQHGFSSLLMVLLLLALGSILLQGSDQRQRSLMAQTANEVQAIRDTARVHSALQWGKRQPWQLQPALACQYVPEKAWRVCLRIFNDVSVLLIARSGSVLLWQSGQIIKGKVLFSPHGWSDFCPLNEVSLCQIP
ncbi:DUF2509 family protein [Enterobacteriaceae bacterium ESL0689]|nr:DUF2509 family protein [Enterobacteriaceae bacterium ESL0689]